MTYKFRVDHSNKLGFAVNNLKFGQLSYYLLNQAKNHMRETDDDIIIFRENDAPLAFPVPICQMIISEMWGYSGTVIATNLSTASKLINTPGPRKRFFYVWDLEWIRNRLPYGEISRIYRGIPLIVRSEHHKQIIENCWNVQVSGIVDDFNISKIQEIIK